MATSEDLSWLTVQLDPPTTQARGDSAFVSPRGDFEIPNVPAGLYTLRVIDRKGTEITSQQVTISGNCAPVYIELPSEVSEKPTGETTSVARLRHTPNRKAMDAARKAARASQSGDLERAALEWKRAVEADPECSEAHENLGVQYTRLNRLPEAVEEFRKALALDRFTAGYHANLAVALGATGQIEEAETSARAAVRMDDAAPLNHYVLGCLLATRTTRVAEGVAQLQIAARQLPRAHQVLAAIYRVQGNAPLAATENQQYEESLPVKPRRGDSIHSFLH